MQDITRLIIDNNNIEPELKNKIIECINLIISNYPMAYKNLYKNLENIKIVYKNEYNREVLDNIGASSAYISEINTLILEKRMCDNPKYKNLLIHEFLHVSSYHDNILGLKNVDSGTGISLNEGLTEYLTRTILKDMYFGIEIYNNDINNVFAFEAIISEAVLVNAYFNEGIINVLENYLNTLGINNNLKEILINMDNEHIERVRNFFYNSKYKDEYIKLLVEDISKTLTKSDEEITAKISFINSFIRGQYQSKTVPENIKKSIENSISNLFSNYSFIKGKKYEK